jgi:SAM-dependent methyltransferase
VPESRTIVRFGKPSGPLLQQKTAFFQDNDRLQENVQRICNIYARQPKRSHCKNCSFELSGHGFRKLKVLYFQCANCGHLNGAYEDTDEFCHAVYAEAGGASYAQTYSAADREAYDKRVSTIYLPKAEFLAEVLHGLGETFEHLSFADMGAGSGYFVAALLRAGATKVVGYEVSECQVELARQMVERGAFKQHALADVETIAPQADAAVVSMVGVLEHLRHPRTVLSAIKENPKARYIFLSIPLFSPSVYFEAVFPNIFHRHLGAGHTHLYTDASLDWMCREFGFDRVGEWWFGTDMVDLYRHVLVTLGKQPETAALTEGWQEAFRGVIDSLQLELDTRRLSSEVHLVLRKQ